MNLLIKNGYVVDPSSDFEGKADIFVEDGLIAEVGQNLEKNADRIYDAEGLVVMPGLVDLHVHLRDPGLEYKEDVVTGCRAAARGGVTSMMAMANTKPVVDTPELARYVEEKAKKAGNIHVYQAGAITKGLKGEELADIRAMIEGGVKAFSEDGKSVMNSALLAEAMSICAEYGIPVMSHCEDINMVRGGVVNADENAKRLGMKGITNGVEDIIESRDAILAKETGCHLHLCHCSTKASPEIITEAKKMGVSISAEVCPHHFTLTSDDITSDDGNFKMNPPLRSKEDKEALIAALKDGTIDVISTDHAPHAAEEKNCSINKASFGIVGLETSAALTYTELVKPGILTLKQMVEKMSYNPARILKIDAGTLKVGHPADIAVFDFEHPYVIDPSEFASKGKNTPFGGKEVYGRTKLTVSGGLIEWEEK